MSPNFPPDEYLSNAEITELHGIMNSHLEALLDQGRRAVAEVTSQQMSDADALDLAVTESNRDLTLRMADRERRLLRKIRHALRRVDEGEYGTCESCGEPITFARLLARPVATKCIDCKTQAEQIEHGSRAGF